MRDGTFFGPIGGDGGTAESDETFVSNRRKKCPSVRDDQHEEKVFAFVERGAGLPSFHIARSLK